MRMSINLRSIIIQDININNLIVAIIMCFSLINGAIGREGISYLTISFVFVFFVYGLFRKQTKVYLLPLVIILFISAYFAISLIRVYDTTYTIYYLKYFWGFCVISLLAGTQNISIKNVLRYSENIGIICCLVFIIRGFNGDDASILMGISYSMLPVFYAALINLRENHYNRIISLLNVIIISWCYIFVAPRGIWLNVAITIALYVFVSSGKNSSISSKRITRIALFIISIVGVLVIYKNFKYILVWLYNKIYEFTNIKVYALDKMIYLLNTMNLANGRDDLIVLANKIISGHLLFGRGIGFFESIQGSGGYVHNIIYQVLCEGGLILFVPFLFLFLYLIRYLFHIEKNQNRLEMDFFLILLSNGFILLLYSSVHWKLLVFWLLIGYTFRTYSDMRMNKKCCS